MAILNTSAFAVVNAFFGVEKETNTKKRNKLQNCLEQQ